MVNEDPAVLAQRGESNVIRDSDRVSFGVVRILSDAFGKPGEEREYEPGDEALVENGVAEWVVAPVHSVAAGRRLDHDAEREATPLGGIEAFPIAGGQSSERQAAARRDGYVKAHSAEGFAAELAGKRAEVARKLAGESDAALQASLGNLGARSGPVTAHSDLPADKAIEEASASAVSDEDQAKATRSGSGNTPAKGK